MQYVVGNWKMHTSVPEAVALAGRIEDGLEDLNKEHPLPTVILCPPFTALSAIGDVVQDRAIVLGAQNAHWADHGAYTGEISATQLKDLVGYVIVGHSERRATGETNEIVARKVNAVARAGLKPILCVGEKKPTAKAASETDKQLRESLAEVDPPVVSGLLIAYEPVWAVGTGEAAESGHIAEMASSIVKTSGEIGVPSAQVLYGGSIDPENVDRFVGIEGVDGLLVGGASTDDQAFLTIVGAVARDG